jgi:hypothetical protein
MRGEATTTWRLDNGVVIADAEDGVIMVMRGRRWWHGWVSLAVA